MIRILHVVNAMNRGGLETTLMNIFRNIDRDKLIFDFLVFTEKKGAYDDEINELGGKIYHIPPRRKNIFKNIKALNLFFKNNRDYQIVHQHVSSLSNIEVLKAANRNDIPIRIIHSRNTQQGGVFFHKYIHRWNQRKIDKIATDYFACSDNAGKWLFGNNHNAFNNYKIINNGIVSDRFIFNQDIRNDIRKELGIGEELVLGNVGRFHHQKNHMFLLEIFKSILDYQPNSKLILVGDGGLKSKIVKRIEDLGLNDSVIITGVRSDVNNILQAFDIFIMPSFYEGLPGSIIEAQGAGLPCLISDTITEQVKITNLVTFYSLNKTAQAWGRVAFELACKKERKDTSKELVKASYDMKFIAKDLESYYLKRLVEID